MSKSAKPTASAERIPGQARFLPLSSVIEDITARRIFAEFTSSQKIRQPEADRCPDPRDFINKPAVFLVTTYDGHADYFEVEPICPMAIRVMGGLAHMTDNEGRDLVFHTYHKIAKLLGFSDNWRARSTSANWKMALECNAGADRFYSAG